MIRHSVLLSGILQLFMSNFYPFILSLDVFCQLSALPDSISFFLSFSFAPSSVSNILQQSQLWVQNFKHSSGIWSPPGKFWTGEKRWNMDFARGQVFCRGKWIVSSQVSGEELTTCSWIHAQRRASSRCVWLRSQIANDNLKKMQVSMI
jgi:hypothetical protein